MKGVINKIYCLVLLALLCFPIIGVFYPISFSESCDNRELAQKKDLSFENLLNGKFESYFQDHFSARNTIIRLNSFLKYRLFKSSALPKESLIGKEGWFYYTSESDFELKSYSNKNLLTSQELKQSTKEWESRKKDLNKRGIQYHMAVWPNKSTIYPEYAPWRLKLQKAGEKSKTDQVLNYLRDNNSTIQILDVRRNLLDKKKTEKIYHKQDTHWNCLGAFYAYQDLMSFMGIEPYQKSDFKITWEDTNQGDLKGIMGLCNSEEIVEKQPLMDLVFQQNEIEYRKTDQSNMFLNKNSNIKSNSKILVFRDSYTSLVAHFLSLHFNESYYIWSDYDQAVVDKIKPDVVLVAKVERYF